MGSNFLYPLVSGMTNEAKVSLMKVDLRIYNPSMSLEDQGKLYNKYTLALTLLNIDIK